MAKLELTRTGDRLTIRFGEYETESSWQMVTFQEQDRRRQFDDAGEYGRLLFERVLGGSEVGAALLGLQVGTRLQIVTEDPLAAAVGWEYLRTPDDTLLAGRLCFVRGLTAGPRLRSGLERTAARQDAGSLQIVAVPVSPADQRHVLNVEAEWDGICAAVQRAHRAVKLLRVRPPTVSQMERTFSGHASTIVHFMGHSDSENGRGVMLFEDERGRSFAVTPQNFADSLDENVLLVLLNSCRSALAADWTEFGNIARGLVRQGIPYALGMQYSIPDPDAIALSAALYDFLLSGRTVEDAVRRARRVLLQDSSLPYGAWLAGIPALYTSLSDEDPPISVTSTAEGEPSIVPDIQQLRQTWDLTQLGARRQFVGRAAEISRLLDILLDASRARLVVVHGLGGIGKTALVQAVADRIGWRYGDCGLAYSFETFARRSDQGVEVNPAFGGRFYSRLARHYAIDAAQYPDARALQYAILQARQHRRDLLILDNMETLFDALERRLPAAVEVASFVLNLCESKGDVLVTSRSLPPADWEPYGRVHLEGLSPEAGADLFQALLPPERAEAAPEVVRLRLSERVDGHPLSLRLLAGRFARLVGPLDEFVAGIETQLRQAEQSTPASLEDADRQRTLFACMAYSERLLSDELRETLRRVTIFQTPFPVQFAIPVVIEVDEDALQAVVGEEEGEEVDYKVVEAVVTMMAAAQEEAEVRLQDLVRLGMLTRDDRSYADGTLHLLELHPMLRWYLAETLRPPDPPIVERYAQQYARLAREVWEPVGGYTSSGRLRALVRQSLPDLETALLHLHGSDLGAMAYYLAALFDNIGLPQRALELYKEALKTYQELGDVRNIVVTQRAMAEILRQKGQPGRATELFEASLKSYQELSDVRGIAVTQSYMADLLRQQGQPQRALELLEAALKTYQELGDLRGLAVTQYAMADLLSHQGQPERAMELFEAALKTYQELGDVRGTAVTQYALADLLRRQGQPGPAMELLEAALKTYQELGDVRSIAVTQHAMAELLRHQGQPGRAMELFEAALKTKRELGDVREIAVTENAIADLLRQQGQPGRAMELYETSLKTFQELGDVRELAVTQHAMADLLGHQGQPGRAQKLFEASLETYQELGEVRGVVATQLAMANLFRLQGQSTRAMELYEEALKTYQELGDLREIAGAQHAMADLLSQQGQPQRAMELYEEALKTYQEWGDVREIAAVRHAIAHLLSRQGQRQRAMGLYEEVLKTYQELGDVREIAATRANFSQLLVAEGEAGLGIKMAWQAYVDLSRAGYIADASAVQDVLCYIKIGVLGVERFDSLWTQALSQRQPDWLREVTPSPAETVAAATISSELTAAIREYVGASDWQATQAVVEQRQLLLFRDEVERIFQQNIDAARSSGETRDVAFLQTYLELLRACKRDGIAAAFAALAQRQEENPPGDLPRDLPVEVPVDREVLLRILGALQGSPDYKLALLQELQQLAGAAEDSGLRGFYVAAQNVLVGGDMHAVGKTLDGIYAQLWAALTQAVENEKLLAALPEGFKTIGRNTLAVLGPVAGRRSEWRSVLVQGRNQAAAAGDGGMVGLVDAILALLDAGGDPAGLGDTLQGMYAQTWHAIVAGLN